MTSSDISSSQQKATHQKGCQKVSDRPAPPQAPPPARAARAAVGAAAPWARDAGHGSRELADDRCERRGPNAQVGGQILPGTTSLFVFYHVIYIYIY